MNRPIHAITLPLAALLTVAAGVTLTPTPASPVRQAHAGDAATEPPVVNLDPLPEKKARGVLKKARPVLDGLAKKKDADAGAWPAAKTLLDPKAYAPHVYPMGEKTWLLYFQHVPKEGERHDTKNDVVALFDGEHGAAPLWRGAITHSQVHNFWFVTTPSGHNLVRETINHAGGCVMAGAVEVWTTTKGPARKLAAYPWSTPENGAGARYWLEQGGDITFTTHAITAKDPEKKMVTVEATKHACSWIDDRAIYMCVDEVTSEGDEMPGCFPM